MITALALALMLAAAKPLQPGSYVVKACPDPTPAVAVPCEPAPCEVQPCTPDPTCAAALRETEAAQRRCLQSLHDNLGDIWSAHAAVSGVGDPQIAPRRWYKDWRFWAATGGAAILGAVIQNNVGHDAGKSLSQHKTIIIDPPDTPGFCWPPGHCR